MSNPKTEVTGEIQTIEEKAGKKNPWYIVSILATVTGWDGNSSECVYQFKAFGKSAGQVKGMAIGDYVHVKCEVQSREWKNENTGKKSIFTELSAESVEVLNNAVKSEQVTEQVTEQADGQDTTLPF